MLPAIANSYIAFGRSPGHTVHLLNPSALDFDAVLLARIVAKDPIFWIPYDATFSAGVDALGNINGLNANAPNASGITEVLAGLYSIML